ncbi:Zinc finger MYND-type [Trinorchestia longiramus]|nr:Zinc finger MYND-type [Trinorchestia longiramus]
MQVNLSQSHQNFNKQTFKGPTISVQQLIAAHRKDNPSTPPVRGAKRGAWRQKYDNGSGKRGSGRGGDNGGDRSSSLTLSDPTVSYNDVLLQFAQLTQQQNAEKNGPGSPQISIIPVSDSGSGGSSQYGGSSSGHPASVSGGLSVTATSSKHSSSSMLEGTSALAKLLMESRSNTKQNALLEQHQQQPQQQVGGSGVGNSQYLTLSALLSGGTTTTVREKAAAAAAAAAAANAMSHHQSGDGRGKKSDTGLGDPSAPNPKCQGCHKERAQFVCAGCGNQWYCSRDCQVAAWDEHSERCNT